MKEGVKIPMIHVGIIGCGKIAQVRHIPEYEDNPNAQITGFFDLNHDRAVQLAKEHGGKAFSSVIAAVTLTVSVSLILYVVCGFFLSGDPMPLYRYSKEKGSAAYAVYFFVLIVGIYSTLFCSHYGLMKVCRGETAILQKIVLSLAALALARAGFEKIVEKVYPAVGVAGLALLIFLTFLRVFSRVKIRSHTSRRQECTEPRCLPLRDRV